MHFLKRTPGLRHFCWAVALAAGVFANLAQAQVVHIGAANGFGESAALPTTT
jgi:hypothetical protein